MNVFNLTISGLLNIGVLCASGRSCQSFGKKTPRRLIELALQRVELTQ